MERCLLIVNVSTLPQYSNTPFMDPAYNTKDNSHDHNWTIKT
jgi:hypothetical protein